MDTFTGKQYVKIAVANAMGLDKTSWETRLNWFDANEGNLYKLIDDADDPILYYKACTAWEDTKAGIPTGFVMSLDACASGIQLMAALIGCERSAKASNLIDTGKRQDIYQLVADQMNSTFGLSISRNDVKPAVMTHFYGSKATPKRLFGEDTPELGAFYKTMNAELPGATSMMDQMLTLWDPFTMVNQWTLPDYWQSSPYTDKYEKKLSALRLIKGNEKTIARIHGGIHCRKWINGHVAHVKVMEKVDKKVEVDELDHATFTHRLSVNQPVEFSLAIPANIIQSIDGYVVREMVRRCNAQGFQMAPIHDAFWASPNDMNHIRQFYNDILAEIADSNIMQNILDNIAPNTGRVFTKFSWDLGDQIRQNNYALS